MLGCVPGSARARLHNTDIRNKQAIHMMHPATL